MNAPTSTEPASVRAPLASKVPEVTALFWIIKVLTTGMGEAASDFLVQGSLVLAGAIGTCGLAVALVLQLHSRTYRAERYWFAVAMVAVFGTMAADGFHRLLGLPYPVTTTAYAMALAVIFMVWWRTERTLSIHSIVTRSREIFYWLTVLATFALGTAAGDLTAFSLHLGYLASILFFAAAIAVPAIARAGRWMNGITAFWIAYVLTRPLGASIADWLGKPRARSGLGVGDGTVTVLATGVIVGLLGYLARRSTSASVPGFDHTEPQAQRGGIPGGNQARAGDGQHPESALRS